MEYFIYCGYIFVSSFVAYPLLKWKGQHPKALSDLSGMIIFNALILGLLPFTSLLMKFPPDSSQLSSADYYHRGKIWIWNK